MALAPIIGKAVGVATPFLLNKLFKPKRFKIGGELARFRAAIPEGRLTAEDLAQGERFRERGGRTIGSLAAERRAAAQRRFAARGLAGSPLQERALGMIGEREQEGVFDVNRAVEDFLAGRRREREGFEREKILAGFGAELGAKRLNFERDAAREAAFFSSMERYMPELFRFFGSGKKGGGIDFVDLIGGAGIQ